MRKKRKAGGYFNPYSMPSGAARRLHLIMEQERQAKAAVAKPERAKPVSVRPIVTRNAVRHDYYDTHFDERGWFGHGDNGHQHIDVLMTTKSYYSMDLFREAIREHEFEHLTLFDITDVDFEGGMSAFMENVAMGLCNQSMRHWTSFTLNMADGRKGRDYFGIATAGAAEMMFLVMACPPEFTSNKIVV